MSGHPGMPRAAPAGVLLPRNKTLSHSCRACPLPGAPPIRAKIVSIPTPSKENTHPGPTPQPQQEMRQSPEVAQTPPLPRDTQDPISLKVPQQWQVGGHCPYRTIPTGR